MELTQKIRENILIGIAWLLIFASTPLYLYYVVLSLNEPFNWYELCSVWCFNLGFLVLFLIHHYLLVPYCILGKRIGLYMVGVCAVLGAFTYFLIWVEPRFHLSPEINSEAAAMLASQIKPPQFPLLPPPVMARLIIGILMLGVDLGVVAWFNQQQMHQRLLLLEKQHIRQELEQLRYQINPHFFMNTLNNIHALVDIDQEQAKRVIIELSGLMRYTLYEGSSSTVPLSHEVQFLQRYISLMKLRYSEKVSITFTAPDSLPDEMALPPLLLVTFVENAFKHGISYQIQSFIHVKLWLEPDRKIHFQCVNRRHTLATGPAESQHQGIGIANVRKRLELLYTDQYQLSIREDEEQLFHVDLVLPLL